MATLRHHFHCLLIHSLQWRERSVAECLFDSNEKRSLLLAMSAITAIYIYQAASILSVLGSGMVILTLVLFKTMRSKLFMQIIAYISLADILGNIEYTMTYRPSNDNWWCSTQGFLNLYGYPCSWLWTTILMQFLHDLVMYKKILIPMNVVYAICWGAPLVTTLLYLAFIPEGTYERPSDSKTLQTCSYGGTDSKQGFIWHMISYYGLFIACIAYMIHLYLKLRVVYQIQERTLSTNRTNSGQFSVTQANAVIQRMKLTSDSLLLYPLIMFVFWCPHIIGVIMQLSGNENIAVQSFTFAAATLKILSGLATAVLFFWKSNGSRTLWIRFLSCKYSNAAEDDRVLDTPGEDMSYRDSSMADYSVCCDSFSTATPGAESVATGSSGSHISAHLKHMSSPSISNPLGRDLPPHLTDSDL